MTSIWNPNYNTFEDFRERTERALKNKKSRTFQKDAEPKNVNQEAANWLTSILKTIKNPSILEVGCGYGRWSYILKNNYKQYTGIDITKARIEYAKNKYPDVCFELINSCNWNLNFKFDVIFSVSCLQHLTMQDAIDTLKIIKNHLKPNGVVLLHEARMEFTTEEEAETIYNNVCPKHVIQKPISLFEKHVPELKWEKVKCNRKHHHQFILRLK